MNPHLFVYGSLVAAAAHPKGARLRQEALFLGPATIAGRNSFVEPAYLVRARQRPRADPLAQMPERR